MISSEISKHSNTNEQSDVWSLPKLRQVITSHFNNAELRSLASDLGIDHEILPGDNKEDKARELVDYCRRYGRTAELVTSVHILRPQVDLPSIDQVASPSPLLIQRLEAQLGEIKKFTNLFNRGVFYRMMENENPYEMFRAIRETRVILQREGASLVPDREVGDNFEALKVILEQMESKVEANFPEIIRAFKDAKGEELDNKQQRKLERLLKNKYYKPVMMMIEDRDKIRQILSKIHTKIYEMNDHIEKLMAQMK